MPSASAWAPMTRQRSWRLSTSSQGWPSDVLLRGLEVPERMTDGRLLSPLSRADRGVGPSGATPLREEVDLFLEKELGFALSYTTSVDGNQPSSCSPSGVAAHAA